MQFKIQTFLITAFLFFGINQCFAQVIVSENKKVGVGQENLNAAKMSIYNNEWDYGLRVDNLTDTNNSKFSILNTTNDIGTGAKYGIHNTISQNASANKESVGILNYVNAYGSTAARGIGVNNIVRYGDGRKYGIFNTVHQSSTTNLQSYGLYNSMIPSGGDSYGVYTNINRQGSSKRAYGVYSFIRDLKTSTNQRNYGTYSRIDHEGFIDNYGGYIYMNSKGLAASGHNGKTYGLYVLVAGAGDTERIGVYSSVNSADGYAGKFVGDVHISGTLTNPSDEKLKANIKPIGGAMEIVNALQPKSYNYKKIEGQGNDSNTLRFGFLAGELKEVLPNLVHDIEGAETPIVSNEINAITSNKKEGEIGNLQEEKYKKEEDYQAINYIDIIPVLAQAIKEQQVEIENLKAQQDSELESLKNAIQILQKEVAVLKKQ